VRFGPILTGPRNSLLPVIHALRGMTPEGVRVRAHFFVAALDRFMFVRVEDEKCLPRVGVSAPQLLEPLTQ